MRYEETLHHVFWVRVSPDGDLYCTFGYGEFIEREAIGELTGEGGSVVIPFGAGDALDQPLKGGRVSFHASGQINLADRVLFGKPLGERTQQEALCALVFEHPSKFPPLGDIGERDVLVRLPIDERRPLVGAVLLTPGQTPAFPATPIRQLEEPPGHFLISFEGLLAPENESLTVQVVIGHGPRRSWPPESQLVLAVADGS